MRFLSSWKSFVMAGVVLVLAPAVGASAPPPPMELAVRVDGLTCPFCAYGIEKRVKRLEAVASYHIEVRQGTVSLVAKPGRPIEPAQVRQAIADAGFSPRGMSLTATGTFGTWEGRTEFTLSGVDPAAQYIVSRESKAAGIAEAVQAGTPVRVIGRLLTTGDEAAQYEIAIDRLDASTG